MLRCQAAMGSAQQTQTEKCITDRARYPDEIARLGTAAPDLLPCCDYPDGGQRQDGRARSTDRVAAQQLNPKTALILTQTFRKLGKPFRPELCREGGCKHVMERPRPHRRQI